MIIDSHTHLNDEKFSGNEHEIIARAKDSGVFAFICSGYDYASSIKALELAHKYEGVFATLGVHPHDAKAFNSETENFIINHCNDKKVVAIGETGLDFHYDLSPRDVQKEVFDTQLCIAKEKALPVVIHTRESTEETLKIVKKHFKTQDASEPILNGIFHCYSGSVETAQELVKFGFAFSFGGAITFKNAKTAHDVILSLPTGRLLIETDAPYMTPEPFRGKINEPKYLNLVADKMSEILNISREQLDKIIVANNASVFKKLTASELFNDVK